MKKKVISFTVFILVVVAMFVGFHKTTQAQTTPPSNVTFVVTREEAQYLINILAERPYKESAGLINSLIIQANMSVQKDTITTKAVDSTHKKKK